jgi:hypothetical protein
MKQKIYPDPYGVDTWNQQKYGSVTVHIVNSEQFRDLTGLEPPPTPVSAKSYTEHGFPWFDLYDESRGHLAPVEDLRHIKTIRDRDTELGEEPAGNEPLAISPRKIVKLDPDAPRPKRRADASKSRPQ